MKQVFFLGPEGTFSHILARERFGPRARLVECPSLELVVDSVIENPGTLALVPVENSSGGTVYDTIDGLIRHAGKLTVVEELALDVRIALLRKGRAPVKTVYSHFTQIKHHSDWLREKFPKARLVTVESTAEAARRAAASTGLAALAAPGAAEIYGLEVEEIPPGMKVNQTHFFVIRAGTPAAATVTQPTKTALVAALPNICGSLHAFLGPFARQKISLARIVSRPSPGKPGTYIFFVEIEGDDRRETVRRALNSAAGKSEALISLGAFPVGKRYKS